MIDRMPLAFALRDATMFDARAVDNSLSAMDEEEFRRFYERTARPLWAYLSRITGSPQEADDVLQEAYYRFCRAAARHESESHRRNSLFRIATNVARDAARRASHRGDVPLEEESASAMPNASALMPERQAEIRTDLARGMEKLEPVQREMLWLAYAQGASHEEIAEILGLRTVSIRTLLLRARRKLAGFLTDGAAPRAQEVQR
jgi:RNA polymerase sigma-70 factor (ECF subfamily)